MNADLSPLASLLERPDVWQASAAIRKAIGIATGHSSLDAQLHQGGWPLGAITELLSDHSGSGELQILMPALACLSRQGRKLVFINPPFLPYAPGLHRQGVDLAQLVLIQTHDLAEQVWAASQTLRADSSGALLLWPARGAITHPQLRKLQLAAQNSRGMAVVFRPTRASAAASPAALRLAISPAPGVCHLHILKQRGGWAGQSVAIAGPDGLSTYRAARDLPVHLPAPAAIPLPSPQAPVVRNLTERPCPGLVDRLGRVARQPAPVFLR